MDASRSLKMEEDLDRNPNPNSNMVASRSLNMGEYLDRLEDELGINTSHMKVITLVFGLVLGAHLMVRGAYI